MTKQTRGGGKPLSTYEPRAFPGTDTLEGRFTIVEPITDETRFGELWEAFSKDREGAIWRWLFNGPFETRDAFEASARDLYLREGHRFYAVISKASGKAVGVLALFRADLKNGVIEIGHVCFGPDLQRTRASTEAFYLTMKLVLETLGYRRLEWKCNDLNLPSKRAAERLGFSYEGLFRQHMIAKGENRDTAWYSVLDHEWPRLDAAFGVWLAEENFERDGTQRKALGTLTHSETGSL
ncbi:N-acetyltransferase [Fulvimarina endophytica]|uniref:N-acetyltransferase n=1 Tax=Fulvimarina endophytica TaxID=2293836 RepID=A0A371X0R3_9HYPH|nr:GNAT family protein [Fulvimarina endophytica]RFC62823.1 N-acetyltransferase [Fulvimarina endophytica]